MPRNAGKGTHGGRFPGKANETREIEGMRIYSRREMAEMLLASWLIIARKECLSGRTPSRNSETRRRNGNGNGENGETGLVNGRGERNG